MKKQFVITYFSYVLVCCLSIIGHFTNAKADCPGPALSEGRIGIQIGLYNDTKTELYRLETEGRILEAKRSMAVIVCDSNTSAIDEKFRDFLLATAFLNVHGQLEAYGNALKMADEHIDKVQMWAVINNEVTVHRRELYEAEQPAIEEYNEVSTIIDTFNCHHPLDEIGKPAAIADLHSFIGQLDVDFLRCVW